MTSPSRMATASEFAAWGAQPPLRPTSVRFCPRGDGSPVLVLPGLLGTDRQTVKFRAALQMLDYVPLGWELGLNRGPTPRLLELLAARISALATRHGRMRLVGFGLGGILARWASQARSGSVREVITVNAPFRAPVEQAFRRVSPLLRGFEGLDVRGLSFMVRQPPACAWAALYSRQDGIVAWKSCMDPAFPHLCFEVPSKHLSCMRNEAVFRQVADCLTSSG